jgi:hypothetical protein
LIKPLSLSESLTIKVLTEMDANNEIYLIKDDKYYFLVTEKTAEKMLGDVEDLKVILL